MNEINIDDWDFSVQDQWAAQKKISVLILQFDAFTVVGKKLMLLLFVSHDVFEHLQIDRYARLISICV